MFTKRAFWGIGAAIALFPGIAFSGGRADRLNDGIDSSNEIIHTHSLSVDRQRHQMPMGNGESRAERCIFWPIPITDSGLIRSPILELCDH